MDNLEVEDLKRLRNNARGRIADWIQKGKDASGIIGDYWKYENELRKRGCCGKQLEGGRAIYLQQSYWDEWKKNGGKILSTNQKSSPPTKKPNKQPKKAQSPTFTISDEVVGNQGVKKQESKSYYKDYYIIYIAWTEYSKDHLNTKLLDVVNNIGEYLKYLNLKVLDMSTSELPTRTEYISEYRFDGTLGELNIIKSTIRYIISKYLSKDSNKIDIYSKKIT